MAVAKYTPTQNEEEVKIVTFEVIDFPSNWQKLGEIRCLALAKSFPKHRDIPDGPNPREANTRQPIYRTIVNSLIEEPEIFHELNQGVYLYADIVGVRNNMHYQEVELAFRPRPKATELKLGTPLGQGHSDGRHTILAIEHVKNTGADLSNVLVPLVIKAGVMPTLEDRRKACQRQDRYNHDRKTKYDASGLFENLKMHIPSDWKIAYHQNQAEVSTDPRCSVDQLLQLMGMVSPSFSWLNSSNKRFPMGYATNLTASYDQMLNNAEHLGHLIPDIAQIEFWFWQSALTDYKNGNTAPRFKYGTEEVIMHPCREFIVPGIYGPKSTIFPNISAFRVLLDYNPAKCKWD